MVESRSIFAEGQRGQSTLEYILVLAVVLLAIIAFTSGALRNRVEKTFNQSGNTINGAVNKFNTGIQINQN